MVIITARPECLSGELNVPGDKSITHRALLIGALARGITEVRGFLDAEDCRSTINCLEALGVKINRRANRLFVEGRNMKLKEPEQVLNASNSGTTARLLLGILAGQPFQAVVTGDHSLQKRPMKRIVKPLKLMGSIIEGEDDQLPLKIKGSGLHPINYWTEQASAQVKSAIILAGLYPAGETTVVEPCRSRDHTELLLAQFGAELKIKGRSVSISGRPLLKGSLVRVPGDLSAAAFFIVAAAIVDKSDILLKNVGINPTRSGILDALTEMGVSLELINRRLWGREPVADIAVKGGSPLKGITVSGELIPRLIDEIPVLAVAAAVAEGKTEIKDAAELRVKETDRISALAGQLKRLGVRIEEKKDGMIIEGESRLVGNDVESCGDHRIAMALAVAGLAAQGDTIVHDAEVIGISFPGFMAAMRSLIN
ncbi:MAG: 3-phosphoshikimate 1-carboxyvinyltransferase [Bacillota bacterium]|nr:3-phosphoshikimate 1-carboxyvinyltransferase [Bacillota bacterium]